MDLQKRWRITMTAVIPEPTRDDAVWEARRLVVAMAKSRARRKGSDATAFYVARIRRARKDER